MPCGERAQNGARTPVNSATFPIEAKFGSRRASRGGMGVASRGIGSCAPLGVLVTLHETGHLSAGRLMR